MRCMIQVFQLMVRRWCPRHFALVMGGMGLMIKVFLLAVCSSSQEMVFRGLMIKVFLLMDLEDM